MPSERTAFRSGLIASLLACTLLLAAVPSAGCGRREAPRVFTFTAIPDEDETRLRERFGAVARYLGAELGVPVEFVPVKSYTAAVSAFTNDQVHMAWFGGLSGVQARRAVPGSRAIAQGLEDRAFVSYFIARRDRGLTPAEEFPAAIAGRTLTFGAKASTSGRLMPEFFIRRHFGKAPEEVFRRVGFSDDHSRTIALVASGAWDIGTVNHTVWDNEVKAGHVDPEQVLVIWKTPPYPDYNWSVRGDLDVTFGAGFTDRLTEVLLGLSDPALLAAFPRTAFVPATNADFEPIERTAVELGLLD